MMYNHMRHTDTTTTMRVFTLEPPVTAQAMVTHRTAMLNILQTINAEWNKTTPSANKMMCQPCH